MIPVLPDIRHLDFRETFGSTLLYDGTEGEEHLHEISRFIRSQPDGTVVAFDLRDLEYIGYSYAKPTIRTPLRRQNAGEHRDRRILLLSEERGEFLEGIEAALKEEEMAALVTDTAEDPLDSIEPLGHVKDHLLETFYVVKESGPATTAQIASKLDQSLQNANNRLRSLDDLGLIRREKVDSASGGKEWQVRVL